jgi:hypothetical protein
MLLTTTSFPSTRAPVCAPSRRVSVVVRASSQHHDDAWWRKRAPEGLKHVRRVLLAERKRLEDARKESFTGLGDALKGTAHGELAFLRMVLMQERDVEVVEADDVDEDASRP